MQPGPKANKGTTAGNKQKKIHERITGSKLNVYGEKGDGIAEGVRVNAEQLMDPDCVFFLPCGTAARVTGTHYRREIVVSPENADEEFSGVITLRPSLNEFLKINTQNGSPIDVTSAVLVGKDFEGVIPKVEIVLDDYYFPCFLVKDSSGNIIGESSLTQVNRLDVHGQDPITGVWRRGYYNSIKSKCGASANCTYQNLIYYENGAPTKACTIIVGQVDENADFTFSATTTSSEGNTSGAFDTLLGVDGIATTYAIRATTDMQGVEFQVRARIESLDLTDFDPVDYFLEPQVLSDEIYQTLKEHNTGLRMSAASLLCGFRGSDQANAGLIGVARVPEGTAIPSGSAQDVYNWIATLPYDAYTGPAKQGGHTFWLPKTLRDIMFKKRADTLDSSNFLVIAFIVPPTSAGQVPSFSIVAKSTWEWIYASQSLPQFVAPPGWSYLEALYAVLGRFNPSGENPNHMAKVKKIAREAAKNPALQDLARRALQLGITVAKKTLPALIAGVAV